MRYETLSMKQLSFWKKPLKEHGGSLNKGKRKSARPIVTKSPMHIVLRASRARGPWSLLAGKNRKTVEECVYALAKRYGVRVYSFANVGNHLHLLLSVKKRESLRNYMRVLSQAIMFLVTGARKGSPKGAFWDSTYYSRIVSWGREYRALQKYFLKNRMEAFGFSRAWVDMTCKTDLNKSLAAP